MLRWLGNLGNSGSPRAKSPGPSGPSVYSDTRRKMFQERGVCNWNSDSDSDSNTDRPSTSEPSQNSENSENSETSETAEASKNL